MNKRLLLTLSILFILIVAIIIYFLCDSKESKIVEINFVSACKVCEDGDNVPTKIGMFADVYPDDENGFEYISKLSFKRLDLDRITDSLLFSKPINSSLDPSDALKLFRDERNYLRATTGMYINEPKSQERDVANETRMVKYFYLVCQGSNKVDNRIYFESQDQLKKHISEEIRSGRLNVSGFKPNSIVIVLDCCDNTDNPDSNPGTVTPPPTGPTGDNGPKNPQPETSSSKKYSANIKQNGNSISWNHDLGSADQLTITFKSEVDGKVLVSENVTGRSDYYFSYSNSVYEGSKIKVSLSGTWNNGSKISGSSSLTTTTLECH
jgi:hypothetical protein